MLGVVAAGGDRSCIGVASRVVIVVKRGREPNQVKDIIKLSSPPLAAERKRKGCNRLSMCYVRARPCCSSSIYSERSSRYALLVLHSGCALCCVSSIFVLCMCICM
uniref:Secreted protein n=1 Tax=Syphacia muris TaxID=451379 RepID=A0A0N5AFE7_9BILA